MTPDKHITDRPTAAQTEEARMAALKAEIAAAFARIDALKAEMGAWYAAGQTRRFPHYPTLAALEVRLSALDSEFKQRWDAHHARR